jgi:hypothetical protein
MRYLALSLIVCSFALSSSAGSAQNAGPHMSFTFTTLALKALRLANDYDGAPDRGVVGSQVGLAPVAAAFGAAADAARTSSEMNSMEVLKLFLAGKIKNNSGIEEEVQHGMDAWDSAHSEASDDEASVARRAMRDAVLDRPIVQEMRDHEDACVAQLDAMLRSSRFTKTSACAHVEVPVWADLQNR